MPDGLRLALTTLTVLPVRGPAVLDRRTAGAAMALAPLVGLLLGLAAAAGLSAVDALTSGSLLAAAVAVTALAALTRGLHLDGLADLVDGLASYLPPVGARRVMKAPDVGALGVAAVVLALVLQVTALSAAAAAGRGPLALVVAAVAGRLAVTCACTPATPAATTDGLGAVVAGTVRPVLAGALPPVAALAAAAVAWPLTAGSALDAARVVVAIAVALLVARALRRHAVRRVGGMTGDVLGALVEVTTTVALVVMAVEPPG